MLTLDKTTRELKREYEERFGEGFGLPLCAYRWTEEDTREEIAYSLETGVPFNPDSPRWRWKDPGDGTPGVDYFD